ncbi:MAG TPA: hypothetical protein VFZ61_12655 [Polyangiales bacterium]
MVKKTLNFPRFSRRDSLKICLLPAGAAAARWLSACGDDTDGEFTQQDAGTVAQPPGNGGTAPRPADAGAQPGPSTSGGNDAATLADGATSPGVNPGADAGATPSLDAGSSAQPDAGGTTLADASTDAAAASDAAVIGGGWATGGTKSMQGGYPDPFAGGSLGSACMLYPAQTLGPCYAQRPPTREDISEGLLGLPMRLSFLVVRPDGCTPVPNASVDIWHSGSQGIYSAFRTNTTCNPGTMDVLSQTFCRGVQVANAMGRVDFNTVFPGWYKGRTLHIHFTVRVDGRDYMTSQLYWEDALIDEILAQGDYKARGKRDTLNSNDSQFKTGGATPQQVLFSSAKRADGVLHAWKVLSIRGA